MDSLLLVLGGSGFCLFNHQITKSLNHLITKLPNRSPLPCTLHGCGDAVDADKQCPAEPFKLLILGVELSESFH